MSAVAAALARARTIAGPAAAALLLAACGGASEPATNAGASAADNAADNAAEAPGANLAAAPADGPAIIQAATLAGNGLDPGLVFGMPRGEAVAAATAVFGVPSASGHNDECGQGPMDFVSYNDLQLAFQEDRLVGWSLGGPRPSLRTAGGLGIGAPRSALGQTDIDEESSLGPEFEVDGVGGILDQQGSAVEALWAGSTCQFR